MNKFYVYENTRLDINEIFYVGKGTGNRAYENKGSRRSEHWKRIHNKAGSSVKILADNLDEELAFLVEVERIDQLKRLNVSLVNRTTGGEGIAGYKHSKYAKEKISAAKKAMYDSMSKEEKSWTKEHRINRLDAIKKYYATHKSLPQSEETKRKISESKRANPGRSAGKWMNDGKVNMKVSLNEIDKYLQIGWVCGMLRTHITEEYKQKLRSAALNQWKLQKGK